jgi:hypothetical protein
MRISIFRKAVVGIFLVFLAVPRLSAQSSLVLSNAFIEKYKNRATIDSSFVIDAALSRPHRISSDGNDGDLHFAGRTDDVGLPMVAEIINAGLTSQRTAVKLVQQEKNTGDTVPLSGVWRIWFEHPPTGNGQQVQGDPVAPEPGNSNPDHVFQIHPVTQVGDHQVLQSFMPIPGFQAYDARTAFGAYESLTATVQANDSATQISTTKAGYNYAEFFIQLQGPPQQVDDGFMALASVVDQEGNPIVSDARRMVFVNGTAPAAVLQNPDGGGPLHMLGMPRINLERISFSMQSSGGVPVTIPLPYEMIIVGVFSDQ